MRFPKWFTIILAVTVLLSACNEIPARAVNNYDQQYAVAQGMLYDLQDRDNLTSAKQLFEELGAYKNAKHYTQYVNAVLALYDGDLPAARKILQVLSQITPFTEELTANELPVCETLALYASARLLESGGDTEGARKLYIEANVLDAVDRAVALADQQLATEPLEPVYFAPETTPAPAKEKELADQKLVLEAANQDSGIYLTWSNLEGVAEYEIYWRRTKETKKPFVKVTKLTQNSYTHTAEPHNGFKYSYYVEAVSASGQRIKSNEVQIVYRSDSGNAKQKDSKTNRATPKDPGRTAQPSSGQGTGHRKPDYRLETTAVPDPTMAPVPPKPTPIVTQTPSDNNDGGYGENPLLKSTRRPVQTPVP